MKKWNIMYCPYEDLFQTYDNQAFIDHKKSEFKVKKKGDFRLFTYKGKPVFFEIKKAYDKFKVQFNDMTKKDIIKLIKPQIEQFTNTLK